MRNINNFIGMFHKLSTIKLIGNLDLSTRIGVFPMKIGLFGGGTSVNGTNYLSGIDKVDYYTEYFSAVSIMLTVPRRGCHGLSFKSLNKGFVVGGCSSSGSVNTVDKIRIDGIALVISAQSGSCVLTQARHYPACLSFIDYGIIAGGEIVNNSAVSTTEKIIANTETISAQGTGKVITQSRTASASVSFQDYGLIAGGWDDNNMVTTTDKVTVSNEAISAQGTGKVLTQARYNMAGIGFQNYGIITGGYTNSAYVITTEKVDKITEIISAQGSGKVITQSRYGLSGIGFDSYGIITGGWTGSSAVTTTEKITVSNEAISAQGAGKVLTQAKQAFGSFVL